MASYDGDISDNQYDEEDEVMSEAEFYELKQEYEDEDEFACDNNMEPEYYCWNCKYSDCKIH